MISFLLCLGLLSVHPAYPALAVLRKPSVTERTPVPKTTVSASMSADILRYVNDHRRSMGLHPLEANSFISSVALGHSRDMLTGRSPFGHDGFRDRIDRIRKRLGHLHTVAENVASGPMTAREVVDGWLHSPGHRRNIEGDFRLTGIGVASARNGRIYFTQIFTK
ncbi:MAG TPA: CAP domain-containing protein [Puia sp.]|nr:CAP domain-containing protein [Puia sp.]